MKRPSLALAMIVKNEIKNLPLVFDSVEGCVDAIYITDTGSTDGTKEYLEKLQSTGGYKGIPITMNVFEWCDDFSKARNASFDPVEEDYVMWLDGDDVLTGKENFILWRDNAMALSDYWLNVYHYASDAKGKPVCSFARERVVKNHIGLKWRYFLHEGIPPNHETNPNLKINYINTWSVTHRRTIHDLERDKGRNLGIMKKHEKTLDSRMKYYYGKEFFDAKDYINAINWLMEAVSDVKLDMHDRVLGCQYACNAYFHCNQFDQAIAVAHQGLQLDPNRAEFWVCLGDCYLKTNRPMQALPVYAAALNCKHANTSANNQFAIIFNTEAVYTYYPANQIARIQFNLGNLEEALKVAESAMKFGNPETKEIYESLKTTYSKTVDMIGPDSKGLNRVDVDDIIISAPPSTQMYEWDSEIAKKRGVGGSETAAIHMATWLKKLTKRPVKVFNGRSGDMVDADGVEYVQNTKLAEYCASKKPKLHIAWRHTIPVTPAKTVVWSHDLLTPNVDQLKFDEVICLSPFHAKYMQAMQGVPPEKMWVSRNGIDPTRFKDVHGVNKVSGKVIFPSSPDRGLMEALKIMDHVVKDIPLATLHVFYGFDNMRKSNMRDLADMLEGECEKRSYVHFHGNVQQNELARHFMESEVWLYPASFIETYCITALESIASRCYPIATNIGALQNTVGQFAERGLATLLDERAIDSEQNIKLYADHVKKAIEGGYWQKIDAAIQQYSWESVAKEWIEHFGL